MRHGHDQHRSARETEIFDEAAETPSRVYNEQDKSLTGGPTEAIHDKPGGELRIEQEPTRDGKLPPPSAHRADRMVRAVGADARQEMEHNGVFRNQASFTKGVNAPTVDQTRYPYTTEDMDEMLREAPRGLFPDTPGGDGATPLSADRTAFLEMMGERGHFPSRKETERWARAVFNALRHYALERDEALATELASVVRIGEAPEVQVEEMMWGGDFVERLSQLIYVAAGVPKQAFYEQVAEEVEETPDDPWVDAAVHSYLGTLKSFMGDDADRIRKLGDLQAIWDRV